MKDITTLSQAIKVLEQAHIVAHHDNDGIQGEDMCGDVDNSAKELDEALDIVIPLLKDIQFQNKKVR
jgi:hypothetical protein